MSNLPLEVVEMLGNTIAKVVPVTIGLALVFSVLSYFWACNPGTPWWRKRELVTDLCYWFFVPLFGRVLRIGLLVLGAGVVFKIHDADELIAFYDNGHGPLAALPLWLQAVLFLVLCASPLAVAAPWLALIYLIPLGLAVWLLRTRTVVDTEKLVIRRVLTRTVLPWSAITSLRVADRKWVRAVRTDGGEVVLPTVRTRHLPALALMSGGRLPDPTG